MKNRPSNWQIKFGGISGFLLLVFLVWRDVFRHAFGGQIALAVGLVVAAMFLVTLVMWAPHLKAKKSKSPKQPWPRESLVNAYRAMLAIGCIATAGALARVFVRADLTLRHWPFSYENSDDGAIALLIAALFSFWYVCKYWRQSRTLSKN
jgi:hypothetical protein